MGDMCQEMDYGNFFGKKPKWNTIDLWYFNVKYEGAISNSYLYNLIKKKNLFLPRFYLEPILIYAKRFHRFKNHIIPYYCGRENLFKPARNFPSPSTWLKAFDSKGLSEYFTINESEAFELCNKLGFEKNKNIIGIHIRDSNSDNKAINELSRLENSAHRVEQLKKFMRQSELRNSDLLDFIPAVTALNELDNVVVRLGRDSKPFDRADISPLVDYPHSGFYSPKNDVILMGIMKYLICSTSGMAALAHWWRKPIFLVDFPDLFSQPATCITYKSAPIILPKVVRYRKDDALLSLEEILNSDVFKLTTPVRRDYLLSPNSEIYLTPNSPDVITNTILLGNLELLQSAPPHLVEFGKKAYQRLYGFESYSLAPVLSPYWPNLLSEGVFGKNNKL